MSSGFKNLGDLIRDDADLTKIAIIDLGGEEPPVEYSYAELDGMAMAVARALTKRGLARGDRVAILSANRAEFIAAYFGIMRAGLVAVPVNYRFPRKTIHLILENAGAKLLFCDRASRDDCPEVLPAVVFGEEGDESFGRFVDPGEFETVIPKRPRAGDVSLHLGLDRRCRRASCSRTRATSGWWRRGLRPISNGIAI